MKRRQRLVVTCRHRHNGTLYGHSKAHGWMLWYTGLLSGWIPCCPDHIALTRKDTPSS
jgi:hypothetical protein